MPHRKEYVGSIAVVSHKLEVVHFGFFVKSLAQVLQDLQAFSLLPHVTVYCRKKFLQIVLLTLL